VGFFSCCKAGLIEAHTAEVVNAGNVILLHYLRPGRRERRKKGGK
jgi:hypothetical protein